MELKTVPTRGIVLGAARRYVQMHRTMPNIDQEPMCLAPSSSPALVLVGLFVKLLYLYNKPKDTVSEAS